MGGWWAERSMSCADLSFLSFVEGGLARRKLAEVSCKVSWRERENVAGIRLGFLSSCGAVRYSWFPPLVFRSLSYIKTTRSFISREAFLSSSFCLKRVLLKHPWRYRPTRKEKNE